LKILVHDLNEQDLLQSGIAVNDYKVIDANVASAPCTGCYDCWFVTPGMCKINDSLRNSGLGLSEETVIISRICYGGYSERVKNVFDRNIPSSTPFFTYRSWKIRHIKRYKINRKRLTVILYGDYLESEKKTAELIAEANRSNMGFNKVNLYLTEDITEIGGILK